MTGQIPQEQVPVDAVQAALFPVTVTAVRREVTFAWPDGGPLTGGDFARLHVLARGGAR
ncbi:hypothetical protein ACIBBE_23965 [Streptomyces sp. NPDC051644]|uniref:hypothetical protein n=1 Tax=Streptomyces sp. NPDC051644 TaxID=3365666 RepID=UPI00378AB1FF